MQCSRCGRENEDGARFCTECGEFFVKQINNFTPVKPQRKQSGCLFAVCVMSVLIFVFMVIWSLSSGDKTDMSGKSTDTMQGTINILDQTKTAMEGIKKIDHDFIIICKEYQKITKALGSTNSVSAYGQIDDLKVFSTALFDECLKLQLPDEYKEGKNKYETGIACLMTSMENLLKYLDDGKPSQLNTAVEKLESAVQYRTNAIVEITAIAVDNGYIEETKVIK